MQRNYVLQGGWEGGLELKERKVYKLVPRKAVPPGWKRIKSRW